MSRNYLSVIQNIPSSEEGIIESKINSKINVRSLTLKQYFVGRFKNIVPNIKQHWKIYLSPLLILGVLFLFLKTSKVEYVTYKTFFQKFQYFLIYLLSVWAGILPRAVLYTLIIASVRIFKGFNLNIFAGYVKTTYSKLFNNLQDSQIKKSILETVMVGASAGLVIGAVVTDYKLKAFSTSLFIAIAILHGLSTKRSFQFVVAFMNDVKRVLKIKSIPEFFEETFLLSFIIGLIGSVVFTFVSRIMIIRMIPGIVLLIISIVIWKKGLSDEKV